MYRISLLLFCLLIFGRLFAQTDAGKPQADTITNPSDTIHWEPEEASEYIFNLTRQDSFWRSRGDSLKFSLERLIDHYNAPFDSIQVQLSDMNLDTISVREVNLIRNDTLPLRWLTDSTFIVDTMALDKDPVIVQKTITKRVVTSTFIREDSTQEIPAVPDTLPMVLVPSPKVTRDSVTQITSDTIIERFIDSLYLKSKNIQIHQLSGKAVNPPVVPPGSPKRFRFLADSSRILLTETQKAWVAGNYSPFYIVPGKGATDSLQSAIKTLLSYTSRRDSFLLYINDIQGSRTPLWLTEGRDELYRYWVKNLRNDSITLWMGNPTKHDLTLILEEDVNVNRLQKEPADDIPIISLEPDVSLLKMEPLKEIPEFWNYQFSTTFAMNQTFLSNWAKGGESSLSGAFDIQAGAKYTDKKAKTTWTNAGRLKYATIITEENGRRTNTDILEFNSQYNKVIKNKIDFSSLFYFKTQIAKGYDYPNDSVPVSKFLNPGTFTIGAGFEYEPFKNTSLNFSALSYKNTFVLDTANIDQTNFGIDEDKRAKQEFGGQLLVKNKLKLVDDLTIGNTLRLFSNYLDEPQNIDVDWEINLDKQINWYFSVALNLHLIYDDDVRFPVLDENDEPIQLPNGSIKKSPKLQLKEFLGLSFLFKF